MIEIGVNLSSGQFQGEVETVLAQARQAGVTHFIATGTSLEATAAVVAQAQRFADVWATAGVHPHQASSWSERTFAHIQQAAKDPRVVAVGECGLDYNRMFSPRQAQLVAFEAQLGMAKDLGKPVFLHCRDAFEDFRAMLSDFPGVPGVVHCFTGTPSEARAYLELGMDLGITGWLCDPKRGGALRDAVKVVPLDRMHLETDAPYLLPGNMPGAQRRARNVPANLKWVAKGLAEVLGRPLEDVTQACTANSKRLFGLP